MHIDLNADVGEGGRDADLLPFVSSINIACGWHAGDPDTMRATLKRAAELRLAVGAHPGYPDRRHFGRRNLVLPHELVYFGIQQQLRTLRRLAAAEDLALGHVKPHGALYNQAAQDEQLASSIVQAVKEIDPSLFIVGLAHSQLLQAARHFGMPILSEGFADRRYRQDGTLVPRDQPDACIETLDEVLRQAVTMIAEHRLETVGGTTIDIHIDTICLHGDGPQAVAFARALRERLDRAGVVVQPPPCPRPAIGTGRPRPAVPS